MNWEAIGAVGEVFGAIAVVVSVIYLAIQVRKQTEEARLAATRELAAQFQSMVEPVAHDSGFSAFRTAIFAHDEGERRSYLLRVRGIHRRPSS
jgi:hypothetical protein